MPVVVNSPIKLLNSDSCGAVCGMKGEREVEYKKAKADDWAGIA